MQSKIQFMREDILLQQAMSAIRAGHELTARDLFLEIVENNPQNETAWMWLTGLLDDPEDCIYACQQVLKVNPNNTRVSQYLDQLLLDKEKQRAAERLRTEEQLGQVREWVKANRRSDALNLLRELAKGEMSAEGWRLFADLAPKMDERSRALEQLLVFAPEDIRARQELERLRHFQDNPLDLAARYEEEGNLDKAIEAYSLALIKPVSKNQFENISWKITRLENLRQENIAHISPVVSVARLTGGLPLFYLLLMLDYEGLNPIANPEPLLWFGFFWVLAGGFMIAFASVRFHSPLWSMVFKDATSRGTPAARFLIAAIGWALALLPFILMFYMASNRFNSFSF